MSITTPAATDFDAFISYSIRADYRLVRNLKAFLETLHRLKTSEGLMLKELKVCVDGTDFRVRRQGTVTGNDEMPDPVKKMIAPYLRQSRLLIVVCCPAAATRSKWIDWEIEEFLRTHDENDVLIAISGGEDPIGAPATVFPAGLTQRELHQKPFYDFRGYKGESGFWGIIHGLRSVAPTGPATDFESERIRLAADLQPDERITPNLLRPVWFRQQAIRARRNLKVVTLVSLILVGITVYAFIQRHSAIYHLRAARANVLSTEARRQLSINPALALDLSLRSLEEFPSEHAAELTKASLRQMPASHEFPVVGGRANNDVTLWDEHRLQALHFMKEERFVLTFDAGKAAIWDSESGQAVPGFDLEQTVLDAQISADGALVALLDARGSVHCIRSAAWDTPKVVPGAPDAGFERIWLSPNGQSLVGVDSEKQAFHVSLPGGGQRRQVAAAVTAACFAEPQGKVFYLTESGSIGVWDAARGSATEIGQSSRFAAFQVGVDDELKKSLHLLEEKHDGVLDANGREFHPLEVTGYVTRLIAESTKEMPGNRDLRALPYEAECNRFMAYLDAPGVLLIWGYQRGVLCVEAWDTVSSKKVASLEGWFSRIAVNREPAEVCIAGPAGIVRYKVSRDDRGTASMTRDDHWDASLSAKRVGSPRALTLSPGGKYLASAYSPMMLLQGAPASSVALWATHKGDARDGNDHFGAPVRPSPKYSANLVFSPSSTRMATYSADGVLRVWSIIEEDRFLDTRDVIQKLGTTNIYDDSDNIILQPVYLAKQHLNFLGAEFNRAEEFVLVGKSLSRVRASEQLVDSLRTLHEWTPFEGERARVSPGYDQITHRFEPVLWNPQFRELLSDVERNHLDDQVVINRYLALAKDHPMLLSNMQQEWADDVLKDPRHPERAAAILTVGLSGDRSKTSGLKKLEQAPSSQREAACLKWSIGFLGRCGRDLSLSGLARTHGSVGLTPYHCLAFPVSPGESVERRIPALRRAVSHPTENLRKIALEKGGTITFSSLATTAFYHLVAGKSQARFKSFTGELLMLRKDLDQALEFGLAAARMDPADPDIPNTVGNIYEARNERREAISWYLKSLQNGRLDGWPQVNLGNQYKALNELDQAESYYREALTREEKARTTFEFAEYLNAFAWFLATKRPQDRQKLDEALQASRRAIKFLRESNDPKRDYPNFLDTLAAIHFARDEKTEARRIQTIARDYYPQGSARWQELNATLLKYQ